MLFVSFNQSMSVHTVETDADAKAMAMMINGSKPDPYYTPARQPSSEDTLVYENYEKALGVINDPDRYDEDEVDEILGTIRNDYRDQYSSYSGNYNADISENKSVQQFYQEYKLKLTYYKGCVTKINNKGFDSSSTQQSELRTARKYMPNDLGKEMNRLIDKVKAILDDKRWDSDSDSE